MPDIIQAVRGVWKRRLKALRAPWVLLLIPPTPSLVPAGGGSSCLPAPGRASPHTGVLCRYVLMAPVKLLFIKIHCRHVTIRSVYVTAQKPTTSLGASVHPSAESTGPGLRSLGRLLSGRPWGAFKGPGEVRQSEHSAQERLRSRLGPRSSRRVLPTSPKAGVSLHTQGRPQKRGCWGLVGAAAGRVQGLGPHCSGGSPAAEQQFVHKSVCASILPGLLEFCVLLIGSLFFCD